MKRTHSNHTKIDTVFIACLFVLFALTASFLVLLEASQYRTTVDSMNRNYEVRTVSSYLAQKVHQHDTAAGVAVTDLDGVCALALSEDMQDARYTTYIYYYDGALRELLVGTDASYALGAGQSIVTLCAFSVEEVREGLLYVTFTDSEGISHEQYLSYHTPSGKEAA
jgi:hypothetical protein